MPAFAVFAFSACSGVSVRPEIAERVVRIDRSLLQEHVRALDAIGPRPVSDSAATRATVDYIARRLGESGYEIHEELFEYRCTSALVAVVRPMDEPGAEPIEIELAPDLRSGGSNAMQSKAAQLAAEGWKVESFRMQALDQPRVHVVPNVIATLRGTREPAQVLELGAHYDTVAYSPGADDNSSGVAALLEVARIAAGSRPRKTLRFCFFGAEEVGLKGSQAHVESLRGSQETRLAGLINLDGVGFTSRGPGSQREPDGVPWYLSLPDEGDFVVVVGKWSSGWLGNLFEGAIDAYAPELPYYSANRIGTYFPDAHRSDHAHYWRAGLPAIFVTDTAEFRSSNYHSPSDLPATLDHAFLEAVTRATAAAALHWAELEDGDGT